MSDTKINDGGPAFPTLHTVEGQPDGRPTYYYEKGGMSLRDYFAAQAMQGMTVTLNAEAVRAVKQCDCSFSEAVLAVYEVFARRAYAIADAMLAERAKGGA